MIRIADDKTNQRRGIDHIGVVVCVMVHDGAGNIVMLKRGKGARDEHGRWDICGGALEFGESIDAAVRREVKEELCADVAEIEFIAAGEAHRVNVDGVKTHWIWLLHTVLADPRTVELGEPHKFDSIGWFNSKTLPRPLHSQFPFVLAAAQKAGIIK